jgi:DNA adenine methylase
MISNLIKNVVFIHSSFELSFNNINKDDFIYLDPPYVPINTTSFVKYIYDSFNLEKHELLFSLCKNFNFIMSNSDVEFVKNHFNDNNKYFIEIILCKRKINSKNPESKINEIIIKSL